MTPDANIINLESAPLLAHARPNPDARKKVLIRSAMSLFNGVLYYAIATEGGENIKQLFNLPVNDASNIFIFVFSGGASLVYTMFTYKTLEALSLKIDSPSKIFFAILSPFAAAAFLTAGDAGAKALNIHSSAALTIGLTLFSLRIINGIDASAKFPERLHETKVAWNEATTKKDYAEIARILIAWSVSLGYAVATTDAIYNSTETISGWFGADEESAAPIAYTCAIAGALGSIPLTLYWSYRGIRQLTKGGKEVAEGTNPDPTDRYTYAGLFFVTPVMLGILGGATSAQGEMFGKLGTFADGVRVLSSSTYAVFAGTPGMATLLRGASQYFKRGDVEGSSHTTAPTTHKYSSLNTAPEDTAPPVNSPRNAKKKGYCSIM
ncbi:MAG: hypothetical protein ACHQAX_05120 [Gammaproteobacteria bacterium]